MHIQAKNIRFCPPNSDIPILCGVDFSAQAGEFTGIVGPNGAGKTTLLKALGGLLSVQGDIQLMDSGETHSLAELSARERAQRLCYMHQDTAAPFAFTVVEIVAMGRYPWLGRFSEPGAADRQQVDMALQRAACQELSSRLIPSLSGGERQRVMLARALAQDTPLLFLDEPVSSLDIRHAQQVFRLCQELAAERRCVVAVLHDLRQAARVCDRLYLMHEGNVVAYGPPEEVLTSAHIKQAYNIQVQVFRNPVGEWDYYLSEGTGE